MTTFERSVYIPDLHCPNIDPVAFRCALRFITKFKPDFIFILGDVIDFYQISRFDRNPTRLLELQQDLDAAYLALKQIRKVAPAAKIYLLRGNHEFRLTKFLWSRAAELISLRTLKVEQLLSLKELDIEYVENGRMFYHGVCIKHGNLVRARSGYTATGELEKVGLSGISGHTHRLSHIFKHNDAGSFTWVEAGCLCDLNPEYAEGQTFDWQSGLVYAFFKKDGKRFIINTLPIVGGELVYGEEEITGKEGEKI